MKIYFLKNKIFKKDKFMIYKYIEIPLGSCHGDLTLSNVIVFSTGSLNLLIFCQLLLIHHFGILSN